jgi:hypothetical protein
MTLNGLLWHKSIRAVLAKNGVDTASCGCATPIASYRGHPR